MIRIALLDRSGKEVDELLPIADAADQLDVTPGRIRQLANTGQFKKVALDGYHYFVRKSEVERYAKLPRKPGLRRAF